MRYKTRIYYTEEQKAVICELWQKGSLDTDDMNKFRCESRNDKYRKY